MAKEIKHKIKEAIHQFGNGNLSENALNLFQTLGYNTERQQPFEKKTYACFRDLYLDNDNRFNAEKALASQWNYIDLLFQLSKTEISSQHEIFDTRQVDRTIIETYLFFAIELSEESYSRTALSQITREMNKVFSMPVMILFKHGDSLTLSVINRRLHKRDEQKDVLEKVTLIKDIRISPAGGGVRRTGVEVPLNKGGEGVVSGKEDVSGSDGVATHRAHIEILFDLSFDELKDKHRFTNFVELHNAWQKTLDIKELNRRFYKELSNWYFWAMRIVYFPGASQDADQKGLFKNDEKIREHNAKNLIRLLTRILFIWFTREKDLIPDELFDESFIRERLLKDFEPRRKGVSGPQSHESKYYRAILQNLFFATLNQTVGRREFRRSGQHMNVTNLMRYESYFKDKKAFLDLVDKTVPFMNGGLFECLDKPAPDIKGRKGGDVIIYEDGFSDRPDNELCVPDYVFFGTSEHADLSEELGNKSRDVEVKGLLNILKSYKFTIAENTPIEEDIALDPELLGKVFEKLLASYNPETRTTARKQTGSFYTPPEIVNYMVDESLVAYLKQKMDDAGINSKETDLRDVISYSENPNPFSAKETTVLIEAIDTCKILDPACGSGAFPMGILHKLVHILGKLDPKNELWKERQIQKANAIDDAAIRDQLIEDIETAFNNNELDYGRKLYLIENCIYGVDIQPIASQISKLRCFISLIVDERVDKTKENFGVRPLPNLETKFVAADTLIGIEKPKGQLYLVNPEVNKLEEQIKDVRHRLFSAKTPVTKRKLREDDKALREKMRDLLVDSGWENKTARQLASWDPYDQNASSPFFDPEWMFGIMDGFDVLIGNPPYISHDRITNKHQIKNTYTSYEPFADIYCYFIECGINLQSKNGLLTYITSNSYLRSDYGKPLRKFIKQKNKVLEIINIEDSQVFESAIVNVAIIISTGDINHYTYCHVVNSQYDGSICFGDFIKTNGFYYPQEFFTEKSWNLIEPKIYQIQKKIEHNNKTLEQLGTKIRLGLATGHNDAFIINEEQKKEFCKLQATNVEIIKPILRGRDISRFSYKLPNQYILLTKNGIDIKKDYPYIYKHLDSFGESFKKRGAQGKHWTNLRACSFFDDFKKEKIVWIELTDIGRFALCNDEVYLLNSAYFLLPPQGTNAKFLLGVLNSKIIQFYLSIIAETSGMGTSRWINNFVKEFPIPLTSHEIQTSIIHIVDQILTEKQKDPNADTSVLERQIDQMVYNLYGLTPEEIKIVEGHVKK